MRFWDEISQRLAGLSSATPEEARQALNEFDTRDIQAVRVAEGGGGGGASVVSCLLICQAGTIDISGPATPVPVLWDGLVDNTWDFNTLTEIPAGLGLDFTFDGSSADIETTEAGTWAFAASVSRNADDTWEGDFDIGFGRAQDWLSPHLLTTDVLTLPSGVTRTVGIHVSANSTAETYTATAQLSIVRLA